MKAVLEALALPPSVFVVLIVAGLLLRGTWGRFGRRLSWVSLAALILFGMPFVSGNLLRALETGLATTPPPGNPPQAIVVLSAEMIRTHQETLGFRPGLLTLDRLRTGAALHRRTGLPILVSGGTGQVGPTSLAAVMAQSLKDDFQTQARWVEDKSTDTWENARFSADILRAEGITSIYLVTHSWHMRRALVAFQHTGLTVTAAPTSLDDPLGPDLDDFLPRASGWQAGYYAAHEWIGYAWYQLR
jgi:uncharacterized SAM-binding protein YcdF (DUF218 family)